MNKPENIAGDNPKNESVQLKQKIEALIKTQNIELR
jgi:hypothetical protein